MSEAGQTGELRALSARLALLEDREAIRDLIATYGPLADCGDSAALARLWTEDGEYEVVGFATAYGQAEIAALIEADYHRALMADGCAHLLGPVAVEVSGDTALARGHSVVFRHSPEGFAAHRVAANRWELVRTEQGWRARRRSNALLDGAAAARVLLAAS
ncbi:MAG: nuclear transport factor 2 family protein [Sphingomonadales bacterium]|nr:nuclear transport factor 2 family protein [Sphingomonadales bacterium]